MRPAASACWATAQQAAAPDSSRRRRGADVGENWLRPLRVSRDGWPDECDLRSYPDVRSLLVEVCPSLDVALPRTVANFEEPNGWREMWVAVATWLLRKLETGDSEEFESGFRAASAALRTCDPIARQAGATALFGSFTRRAIAAGIERTRFVDWLGPIELLEATSGRVRGRVLYFDSAKGRGKILGANRTVYFVHFAALRGAGFRSEEAGQLVEFTPLFGAINGREGWIARDVARLSEIDGREQVSAG